LPFLRRQIIKKYFYCIACGDRQKQQFLKSAVKKTTALTLKRSIKYCIDKSSEKYSKDIDQSLYLVKRDQEN